MDEEDEEAGICLWCDSPLEECQCPPPSSCPICGDSPSDGTADLAGLTCGHLIAGWDDGDFRRLPVPLPPGIDSRDWPEGALAAVFGEALPTLDPYPGFRWRHPNLPLAEFLEAWMALVPEMVRQKYYAQNEASRCADWEAVMYCSRDPAAARKQAAWMERLGQGLLVLGRMAPDD